MLSYNCTDDKPKGVAKYDFNELTTNGDFYKATVATKEVAQKDCWVQLFGRTPEGYSIALHVDFWPSVMVCLPDHWSQREGQELHRKLLRERQSLESRVESKVVLHHRLAGFYPDLESSTPKLAKFPFLQIACKSMSCFKTVSNYFKFTKVSVADVSDHTFEVIEQDIPPVLELLEACRARPSAGLEISTRALHQGDRLTHCDLEYTCKVLPFCSFEQCPLKAVELDEVYPIVIMSFDIECVPGAGRGFPDATKDDDAVVTICSTVKNLKTGQVCRASHTTGQHDQLQRVQHFTYSDEAQMIEEWRDFVVQMDPDIITGYNTQGFDWKYLNIRMLNLNPKSRFFLLSRLIQHRSTMEEKEFDSTAYAPLLQVNSIYQAA